MRSFNNIAARQMMLALLGLLGLVASAAAAQPRYALVIANARYSGSARLTNPVRDGQRLANTLRQLHFRVLERYDVDLNGMKTALRDFRTSLSRDSIALVYYSGHGVEVDGMNYLLPLGYNIATAEDVPDQAYPAERLMSQLAGSGTALNVLVLDACRDSPLPHASKGIGKGLAQISTQTPATLIDYATAAGRTADDDSTYINALIAELPRPGRSILETFNAVGYDVSKATGGKQTPWMYVNNIPPIELVEASSAQPVPSLPASLPAQTSSVVQAPPAAQSGNPAPVTPRGSQFPAAQRSNQAPLVRRDEQAPVAAAVSGPGIGGEWSGVYLYNDGRQGVAFNATLVVNGNQLLGSVIEPNTLSGSPQTLHAYIKGQIDGSKINFTKQYDGNGASHSVQYTGAIDPSSGTIKGNWRINWFTHGQFEMRK